jgi:hypothetical protein
MGASSLLANSLPCDLERGFYRDLARPVQLGSPANFNLLMVARYVSEPAG